MRLGQPEMFCFKSEISKFVKSPKLKLFLKTMYKLVKHACQPDVACRFQFVEKVYIADYLQSTVMTSTEQRVALMSPGEDH